MGSSSTFYRPLDGANRLSLQERVDGWFARGVAWLMRKIMARALRDAAPSTGTRARSAGTPVPLERDPVCGTYVSPEISFTTEQSGQILHFCSTECRDRFIKASRRAASA
jgi:YHS domain-containing protein